MDEKFYYGVLTDATCAKSPHVNLLCLQFWRIELQRG